MPIIISDDPNFHLSGCVNKYNFFSAAVQNHTDVIKDDTYSYTENLTIACWVHAIVRRDFIVFFREQHQQYAYYYWRRLQKYEKRILSAAIGENMVSKSGYNCMHGPQWIL